MDGETNRRVETRPASAVRQGMVVLVGKTEYRVVGAMNTSTGSRALTMLSDDLDEKFRVCEQDAQFRVVLGG